MEKLQKAKPKKVFSDLLIVGLGNPGQGYEKTRHNVGFDLIELLCEQLNLFLKKPLFKNYLYTSTILGNRRLHLVKPLTYMNRSGDILPGLITRFGLLQDNILIVTDNMDLQPGRLRMKPGGSSAGHNGLKSIIHYLPEGKFYRLYVGIGRPDKETSVVDHVLGLFTETDRCLVDASILLAAQEILKLESSPMEHLLNAVNKAGN